MKEYRLNKDGFHAKLQIWTFGSIPYKENFCPYFWLTIFCLFAAPFVLVAKGFKKILKKLDTFLDWYGEKISIPALDKRIDKLAGWVIYKFYRYDMYHEDGKFARKMFSRWQKTNENWEELLKNYELEYKEYRIKIDKEETRKRIARKARYATIIKYTKWLAPVLVVGALAGAVYGWYSLFSWLDWRNWYWMNLLTALGVIALAFLFACCFLAITKMLAHQAPNIDAAKPFRFLGRGIINFFTFFGMFFKTFKDDHCPGIVWDEKE